MAETAKHKTAAEIRSDAEGLKQLSTNHVGFPQRPELEIAVHQALATYELAAQFARFVEIVSIVTRDEIRDRQEEDEHQPSIRITPLSGEQAEQLIASVQSVNVGIAPLPVDITSSAAGEAAASTGSSEAEPTAEQKS